MNYTILSQARAELGPVTIIITFLSSFYHDPGNRWMVELARDKICVCNFEISFWYWKHNTLPKLMARRQNHQQWAGELAQKYYAVKHLSLKLCNTNCIIQILQYATNCIQPDWRSFKLKTCYHKIIFQRWKIYQSHRTGLLTTKLMKYIVRKLICWKTRTISPTHLES